jgi:sporulation protein YlmC with PRC-barrel domain
MKASDLIGSVVIDSEGKRLGHLHEIEARRSGPMVSESVGNALQIHSLFVGSTGMFVRLGYFNREMVGPHGLIFLARRSKGFRVSWDHVESVEPLLVRLNCPVDELELIDTSSL